MGDLLWITLLFCLAVQAVFFAFAAWLQTDKVTDLSYGLTFVVMAAGLWWRSGRADAAAVVIASMVAAWGLRLAGYLLFRILRIGRDARFDGIRERPLAFAKFWAIQGVAVWAVMLPVTLWFGSRGRWTAINAAALVAWLVGFVVEAVADLQKYRHKTSPEGRDRWTDVGLWRRGRHPNYFGEMLCWWAVFAYVAADLGPWAILAAAGPLAITILLLFFSGIPPLEASAERKWGHLPEYRKYRARTRTLI